MAVEKIEYAKKLAFQTNDNVPIQNQCTSDDMNEIKETVNNNADELSTVQQNVENLQEGQGTSNTEITNLKNKVQTLENDNATNKANISTLQEDNNTNKNNITNLQNNKVDKEEGKGLSTNDFTNEEKEKLAGLNNYDDTEIIDLLPKVSNEGESITLENTARAKFTKFRTKGNSKQETRSGKNKIIFDDIKETINQGITCSIKNGVITLNGTASGVVNFYSNPTNISAGKYTLSKNMGGTWSLGTATSSLAILLQQKKEDGSYTTVEGGELTAYSSAKNFTTLDLAEGTYRIRIFTATGNILNNFTWRPQLEEGENFTGFEQGGLMPSAEFPSEIKNVSGNIDMNIYNKNLLSNKIEDYDMSSGTYGYRKIVENLQKKYLILTIIDKDTSVDINKIYFGLTESGKNNEEGLAWIVQNGSMLGVLVGNKRYISTQNFKYFSFYPNNKETFNKIFNRFDIEIELSDESLPLDFITHESKNLVFPLTQDQKLMQGDYLADDGIHHTRKQIVLDGTENWFIGTELTNTCSFGLVVDNKTNGTGLCNSFITKDAGISSIDEEFVQTNNSNKIIYIRINKERLTSKDVQGLKTFLSSQKEKGTPVVIEYELAEEEIETYTEEQKEAYEQRKNAISYKGQTNIFSTNEIKPIFEVEALADIGLLLNNMQAQILAGGE